MLIGCYERVSTSEQVENGYSLEEQGKRMESYCVAMGWTVYKHYTDGGFSGGNTDRPSLQALIRDVKEKRVDKVLVWKLDRLSRSQLDTLYLIEKVFLASGVDFVSMQENFDTSTAFGRAMIGILAVFAQLERETIKERMYMGRLARVKEGHFPGNTAPIGYRYTNGQLIPDEYEAMQIQRIFADFLRGESAYKIADALQDEGYSHSYGRWNAKAVRGVLQNRTYIGENRFSGEWYSGEHQPIIDREIFLQVQRIYKRRSEAHEAKNRRSGKASSLLGGLLVCKYCGKKLEKTTQHGKKFDKWYFYYVCYSHQYRKQAALNDIECPSKRWRMDELDSAIIDELQSLVLDPDKQERSALKNVNRSEILKAELEKLDSRINRFLDLYANAEVSPAILQKRIDEENARRSALESQLEQALDEEAEKLDEKQMHQVIQSISQVVAEGNPEKLRNIVELLIDYIEVSNDEISVYWNF